MNAKLPLVLCTFGLVVAGCFSEPTLKADSETDINASYATVTQNMGLADREKLDAALRDIVLVEVGLYGPLRDAKTYSQTPGELASPFAQAFAAGLNQGVSPLVDMALSASWERGRAKLVVENARALVDGRSAKEILIVADDERKKAREVPGFYIERAGSSRSRSSHLLFQIKVQFRLNGSSCTVKCKHQGGPFPGWRKISTMNFPAA